jgi:hypothetical protein
MMEAVRTSETLVDNNFTRQYIPEDNSEHHDHHHLVGAVVNTERCDQVINYGEKETE